jgi:hypothetical protein
MVLAEEKRDPNIIQPRVTQKVMQKSKINLKAKETLITIRLIINVLQIKISLKNDKSI